MLATIAAIQEMIGSLPEDILSKHLGGDPLTSSCQIAFNWMALSATAFYDSGANGDLIIDKKLAARMEEILGTVTR